MNWITLSNLDLKKGYLFTFKPTPPTKWQIGHHRREKNLRKGGNIFSWKFISKSDDLSTYFIAFQARLPGSTIRRAMASASMTGTPRSRNILEIVLFPVATPPYNIKIKLFHQKSTIRNRKQILIHKKNL